MFTCLHHQRSLSELNIRNIKFEVCPSWDGLRSGLKLNGIFCPDCARIAGPSHGGQSTAQGTGICASVRSGMCSRDQHTGHSCWFVQASYVLTSSNLCTTYTHTPGFEAIFDQMAELSLDTPDVSEVIGNFIARCIADDCLPPSFATNHVNITDPRCL